MRNSCHTDLTREAAQEVMQVTGAAVNTDEVYFAHLPLTSCCSQQASDQHSQWTRCWGLLFWNFENSSFVIKIISGLKYKTKPIT